MNLYDLPIHTLHKRRLQREITTADIVHSVLSRIDLTEERLSSFLYLAGEEILDQAGAIDDKIQQGVLVHPLAGMPIAVKDIFSTKGIPTTCGSKFLENYTPPFESTVTKKLKDVDYCLIGKANLDEFAMGSSTENSAFKITRNPWDLERVPGGSSGGSAAAVASGQALAALGTDTGGSVRQPAAFTGIVGLKPTYGRVSRWGMVAFASSFDQGGPLTKDVEDSALLLQTIAGEDEKDATSLHTAVPDFSSFLNRDIKGMKIGVVDDLDISSCDQEVLGIFESNVRLLKDGGAEIVNISLPNLSHAIATYYIIAPSEASSNLGRYDGIRYGRRTERGKNLLDLYEMSRDEGFGQEVKLRILLGTYVLSAGYYDAYYLKAQKVQNLIRAQYHAAFQQVDTIITPVTPTPAFKIGEQIDDPLQMYMNDVFTIPANLTGIPAISVPAGFTVGNLPVGVQFLANHLDEGKLFRIAHFFENNLNLQKPPRAI
jgi:aspartyl-tRNA(Asn)/glutamyl-tRNA(Gln) amidotransferase subunit A